MLDIFYRLFWCSLVAELFLDDSRCTSTSDTGALFDLFEHLNGRQDKEISLLFVSCLRGPITNQQFHHYHQLSYNGVGCKLLQLFSVYRAERIQHKRR